MRLTYLGAQDPALMLWMTTEGLTLPPLDEAAEKVEIKNFYYHIR